MKKKPAKRAAAKKSRKRVRNAKSGEFTNAAEAKRSPATTVTERVESFARCYNCGAKVTAGNEAVCWQCSAADPGSEH